LTVGDPTMFSGIIPAESSIAAAPTITAVPEPGTLGLLFASAAGVLWAARRRVRRARHD
jgi:hypothetical protein